LSNSRFCSAIRFNLITINNADPNGQNVQFCPRDLEIEPPDFVTSLGCFGQEFVFGQKTLPLFLCDLHGCLAKASANKRGSEASSQSELENHHAMGARVKGKTESDRTKVRSR
jgi:hypothetical protein